jgi:hypothetical protein
MARVHASPAAVSWALLLVVLCVLLIKADAHITGQKPQRAVDGLGADASKYPFLKAMTFRDVMSANAEFTKTISKSALFGMFQPSETQSAAATPTETESQSVSPSDRSISASWCTEDAKAEVAGEVEHQRKNGFVMTPLGDGAPNQSGNISPCASLSTSCCTEDAQDAVAVDVAGMRRSWQTPG